MDPQLLMPPSAADFNFDSTQTSPYATPPSSPKILFPNLYYSAPEDGEEDNDTDFAFDFSGQLEPPSISDADELFYRGKIKPLDPPQPQPKSYNNLKHFQPQNTSLRGRQRTITTPNTTRHKVSRSVSPLRVSDVLSDDQNKISTTHQSFPFGFMWYNKWNLKNLLLFRSTSEGSARITKVDQDCKNSSFRSNDGSVAGSSRRMKRKMSAHEIHYTANRAVAKEMRRKTSLPYKSGFLGCLGFGHNFHEVSSRGR